MGPDAREVGTATGHVRLQGAYFDDLDRNMDDRTEGEVCTVCPTYLKRDARALLDWFLRMHG